MESFKDLGRLGVAFVSEGRIEKEGVEANLGAGSGAHVHYLPDEEVSGRERGTQGIRTLWWGWTSRKRGGTMLTASCLETLPCERGSSTQGSDGGWGRYSRLQSQRRESCETF